MSLCEVGMMVYLGKSFFVGALVSHVFAISLWLFSVSIRWLVG